jgi:hypothetical protein
VSGGRTTWWPKDAAWHRRELIIELGEEHGPGGAMVMDVLSSWAQEQRAAGVVRGGFRVLAREAFVSRDEARAIVEHAGQIGALDDISIDDDGRRFVCRVSGWQADQSRGRAAFRQAAKRDRDAAEDLAGDDAVTERDESQPAEGERDESRSVTPSALPDLTREEQDNSTSSAIADEEEPPDHPPVPDSSSEPDPEVVRLCRLLSTLIVRNDPKASTKVKPDSDRWLTAMRLLIADRGGDVDEVERVLRWSQTDDFWRSNILSPTKLREKFTQLALKSRNGNGHLRPAGDREREERRARGAEALRAMLDDEEAAA